MPNYDYRCVKCKEIITLSRPVEKRNDPVICNCGGECIKIFGVPGVQFKGSGFYKTDNKK